MRTRSQPQALAPISTALTTSLLMHAIACTRPSCIYQQTALHCEVTQPWICSQQPSRPSLWAMGCLPTPLHHTPHSPPRVHLSTAGHSDAPTFLGPHRPPCSVILSCQESP